MRVTTFAGGREAGFRDGKLSESLFNQPRGLCLDGKGNLLVADTCNHCIRKIDTRSGMVTTVAGIGKPGLVNGNVLTEARFDLPTSVVVREDVTYVCDFENGAIRRIEGGTVSTLATGFHCERISLDANGNVLVIDYMENSVFSIDRSSGFVREFPRDFGMYHKIAVSTGGIIYVADYYGTIACWNEGDWKVVARTNALVEDFVVDESNNLLYLDFESSRVGRVNLSSGSVSPFAGSEGGDSDGPLLESKFRGPCGIAMNRSSIYISDCLNHNIRRIDILESWNKGKIGTTRFSTSVQKLILSFH